MLKGINFNSGLNIYGILVFSDRDCVKIVAFLQNYKRVFGIFSLRMRTNGYLGAQSVDMDCVWELLGPIYKES